VDLQRTGEGLWTSRGLVRGCVWVMVVEVRGAALSGGSVNCELFPLRARCCDGFIPSLSRCGKVVTALAYAPLHGLLGVDWLWSASGAGLKRKGSGRDDTLQQVG